MKHDYYECKDDVLKRMITQIVSELEEVKTTKIKILCFLFDRKIKDKKGTLASSNTYVKTSIGANSSNIDKALEDLKRGCLDVKNDKYSLIEEYDKTIYWEDEYDKLLKEVINEYGNRETKELVKEIHDFEEIKGVEKYRVVLSD